MSAASMAVVQAFDLWCVGFMAHARAQKKIRMDGRADGLSSAVRVVAPAAGFLGCLFLMGGVGAPVWLAAGSIAGVLCALILAFRKSRAVPQPRPRRRHR
ncbi:hypothetical protein J2D73_07720 [Acetobacter sacchari]|uniref:Uncharacterized protein n=1 Tax=Acetobacter sacchari TaxID=2661687 RepID=A0ABS3LUU7_9PROT|nr:hypothetical protein [Acetobacter sacchari]MBO1359681.1 hypothetical protein [Acetobacter sacchari]